MLFKEIKLKFLDVTNCHKLCWLNDFHLSIKTGIFFFIFCFVYDSFKIREIIVRVFYDPRRYKKLFTLFF